MPQYGVPITMVFMNKFEYPFPFDPASLLDKWHFEILPI